MRVGYACITIGDKGISYKNFRLQNMNEKFNDVVSNNLKALKNAMYYNASNDIHMFRISSDLIPFASHENLKYNWQSDYLKELSEIGKIATSNDIRLSMHPGQYTVINSPNEEVVKKSVRELIYHAEVLDLLGMDSSCKIILHIGGAYGNKEEGIIRFIKNYKKLSDIVKKRLVIENDDRIYNIDDVLYIGEELSIPVVFDNLHNKVNPSNNIIKKEDAEIIRACNKLWTNKDGTQKIHYSQQEIEKKDGAHSKTIDLREFSEYYIQNKLDSVDIMLEVKDKNLSAIKCNNYLRKDKKIKYLEDEWGRYKYLVLEKSPKIYEEIRKELKDKNAYPVEKFYSLIDEALYLPDDKGYIINAFEHVYGYFRDYTNKSDKEKAKNSINDFKNGKISKETLKRIVFKLQEKKMDHYLEKSLYFYL
jgi:UV DNA damage endonuclease